MLRYKMNAMAARRTGTTVVLPSIQGSVGHETAYLKQLRVVLRALAVAVRTEVLPMVEREREQAQIQRRLQQDMDDDVFRRLGEFSRFLTDIAAQAVVRILGLEARRHSLTFMASARRVLGVDLAAVVKSEDLDDLLRTAATRNAGLIRSLGDNAVQRVQQTVTTALLSGTPVSELKKQIAADFGVSDSRAKLIARDQMAKLNSDMNRFRHEQAGIEKYTWRTSQDERVRERHQRLDGRIYAYGEPTGAEGGLPPGQPVQCRCIAQAIVEF